LFFNSKACRGVVDESGKGILIIVYDSNGVHSCLKDIESLGKIIKIQGTPEVIVGHVRASIQPSQSSSKLERVNEPAKTLL